MKLEFQKLEMKSATTDCNGKGLPLEAATGRWNGPGRQGRLDRESDWKLEWESVNGKVKGKLQKTGAGRDCNWGKILFLGVQVQLPEESGRDYAVVVGKWK